MQPSQNIWQHPLFRQNFRGAETQVDNRTFNYTSFLLSILEFPMDLRMRKDRIHYLQKVQYTLAFFPLLNQTVKNLGNYSKSKFPVNYIQKLLVKQITFNCMYRCEVVLQSSFYE